MRPSDTIVQIFAKAPLEGRVKTRLIPALGEEGARILHERMTERMVTAISTLPGAEIWCETDHLFFNNFQLPRFTQQGDDLGEKMFNALKNGLTRAAKVVLVGTDLPLIDKSYVAEAMNRLDEVDVVLGPAEDGGYGLIGCKHVMPNVFSGIDWGGPEVLAQTCLQLNELDSNYGLLSMVWDVDTPDDLGRYESWRVDTQ